MALSNTAQPMNTSLRKLAVVVATAVAGMSAYAHAAETPKKEETITVTAAPAAQESAWGLLRPSPHGNPRPEPKRIPLFKRFRSRFLWSRPKRWRCISRAR